MKTTQILSYAILFVFLSISCTQNRSNEEITVQFGAKSTVIVSCENTQKDHFVWGKYFTRLPNKSLTTDTLNFDSDNKAVLTYNLNKPSHVDLIIDDSNQINLVLLPNDTLLINVNLSDRDGSIQDINFQGRCATINQYERERERKFGSELRNKRGELFHSNLLITVYEDSMDTLNSLELNYFNEYIGKNTLPEWFIKYETSRINYKTASDKLSRQRYHKYFLNRDITILPKSDNFTNKIKIDNKDAVFNHEYYNFLSDYFGELLPDTVLSIKHKIDKMKLLVPIELKLADSLLTGEQRDIYKSGLISLYLIDQNMIGFADTIITEQKNKMAPKYFNFLQDALASHTILEPGTPAANFYLPDINGNEINLKDFNGKIVLLGFWYPGCVGCRIEFPFEEKLVEELKDYNFTLINICSYTPKDKWLKFIDEFDVKGTNLFASKNWTNMLVNSYKIPSMPHYTLIDENGLIISNRTKRPSGGLLEDLLKIVKK